jgi:hypothetical protein
LILRVVPSLDRPWADQGGYYSCDFFPEMVFAELSPAVEIRQIRDARGRWRSVRGVHDHMGLAKLGPAHAVRCRDPHHVEGILVYGGALGVLMLGVGTAGEGAPLLWIEDERDLTARAAAVLRRDLEASSAAE